MKCKTEIIAIVINLNTQIKSREEELTTIIESPSLSDGSLSFSLSTPGISSIVFPRFFFMVADNEYGGIGGFLL